MRFRFYITLLIILITFSASANHGIEAMGEGLLELALRFIFGVIGTLLFVIFAALRFGLRKYLFSIGVYAVGGLVLAYRAYQFYIVNSEFSGSNSIFYTPRYMQEQLDTSRIWFFATLAIMIIYIIFDVYFIRQKVKRID
ncbi:MAG: hypothetical protein AB8B56_17290 [Crocinitomicaceae bacterium]